MMGRVAERERRLVFGEVAESYHHARPDYPAELIADVVAWAGGPGAAALEVGAGTGKATIPLARSGLSVVALEPSREMAVVLRRDTADLPRVSVVDAGFEDWEPTASAFDLVYSAQAWHWITPGLRSRQARTALRPGGGVALFWNFAALGDTLVRRALAAVYAAQADVGINMPGAVSMAPEWLGDATRELEAGGGFGPIEERSYVWEDTITTAGYVALLGTYSDHRMLTPDARSQLFDRVADVIDAAGGMVAMPTVSRLLTARRV